MTYRHITPPLDNPRNTVEMLLKELSEQSRTVSFHESHDSAPGTISDKVIEVAERSLAEVGIQEEILSRFKVLETTNRHLDEWKQRAEKAEAALS